MSPRLKISNILKERLLKLQSGNSGQLYGIKDDNSILLLGLTLTGISQDVDNQFPNNFNFSQCDEVALNFPAGINLCGLFKITDDQTSNAFNESLLSDTEEITVLVNVDSKLQKLNATFNQKGASTVEFTVLDSDEIKKSHLHLRVTAAFPIRSYFELSSIESTLNELEKKLIGGSAAFQFENSNVYILGEKDVNISGTSTKATVSDLISGGKESKKKTTAESNVFLNVELYVNETISDDLPKAAPYIKYTKKEFKHAEIYFVLDTLVMTPKSLLVTKLYPLLLNGVHRNFTLNKNNLLLQLRNDKLLTVSAPKTYHFLPSELGHFVSIVYSSKQNVDDLKKYRETFHLLFSLPLDKPLFRQANAYEFSDTYKTDCDRLLNPHEKVNKSNVPDGQPYFVQGNYAYYHYMQDDFDDSGWGCAYRSLQTIFSWFRFQGYTNMPTPSHKEIQQCLVNIGDKPSSFVGSKQWIGSTEVSFVLETMLGVTSRIVCVNSGEEMTMKGGELSHHFKTQGTPIMIGGGVLAHTILGVDYNKNTGDIKFLILDPHYTGEDDLSVILKKGWCGWKGPDFWKKDAFYNMCLPLKPKCV